LRRELAAAPDVVVADFPRLGAGGVEAITNLKGRWPDARVLVLTSQKDERTIDGVLRAGADGYVLKNDSCNELFTALRSIAAGKGFISPSIYDHVVTGYVRARQLPRGRGTPSSELTDRERQVMRFIAAGHRTREIAKQLSLSHKTIEKHRTSLMRKLGLRNASAVAAYAIAHGLG
jgi:DNA-binding NarL/FixJ family response regulator